MTTVSLLQSYPDVAEHYRRRFRHVLVDEYQDTNHAQYVLVTRAGRAGRRRAAAGRAVRRRRRRPVDLRVPRRDDPQHPGVRARLPGRDDDPAGAELPLHPDDPVRGQRGDRPQPQPQAEEPVDRRRRRRADRRVRRRQRARRGRLGRRRDRPAVRHARTCSPPTSRSSTAPTRSPGCSRRCSSGSACRTRWSAGCASTSARRSATRWPTCGLIANPDDVVSLRRILNTPRRGIGDRAEACVEALSARERISFGEALERADEAPGHRAASAAAIKRLRRAADRAAGGLGRGRQRAGGGAGGGARPHRLPARAGGQRRPAGRGPGGQPAGAGLVAREYEQTARGRRRHPGRTSSSRSRWSPTPTRSRTRTATAAWSR